MGQTQPVGVFVLVTEQTLEENLLATLSSKRDLAMAALDSESRIAEVDVRTQSEDLKAKLEILLGARPDAPVDETVKETVSLAAANDRLAVAGSTLLRTAFDLIGEIAGAHEGIKGESIRNELRATFDAKIVADESGQRRLSVAMPSRDTLAAIMQGLAGLLVGGDSRAHLRTGSARVSSDANTGAIAPN